MSFALLAPFGLAALAALALPILLHLVRRLDLQTTDFAALRWIGHRVRPRRRLRFERPWLLLLRLALLTAVALLLAQPVRTFLTAPGRPWVVVAPSVALADARAVAQQNEAEWHWLAPEFPPVENAPSAGIPPLASLLRQLDAELPAAAPLVVVVPSVVEGLDGERVRLRRAVEWRIAGGALAAADATAERIARTLVVRGASQTEAALPYLRAVVAAWNASDGGSARLDIAAPNTALPAATDWVVWLGAPRSHELDEWIEHGGTAVVAEGIGDEGTALWRDGGGRVLARTQSRGRGRVISIDGFTPAALPILLEATFPARLLEAFSGPPRAPTRATAAAAMPELTLGAGGKTSVHVDASRPLDAWFALLVALLFLAERTTATRKATTR